MEFIRRFKQMKLIIFILFAASSVYSQSERSVINEGNRKYKENKFIDAEVNYRKSLEKNKDSHYGTFNLGDALYKQEKFEEAAEKFKIAATQETDKETRAKAFHNLGNSLLKSQKFPESIEAYKNSLKLNPKDVDTKYNLEYAKMMLQQQQQQQKQNQDKQDQKKDNQDQQQKQDQQKQDQEKKDQQKQEQQEQEQQKQEEQKQQQAKQQEQKISKEDAERMLEALKNEEKDVQKKLKKKAPARISIEKDW